MHILVHIHTFMLDCRLVLQEKVSPGKRACLWNKILQERWAWITLNLHGIHMFVSVDWWAGSSKFCFSLCLLKLRSSSKNQLSLHRSKELVAPFDKRKHTEARIPPLASKHDAWWNLIFMDGDEFLDGMNSDVNPFKSSFWAQPIGAIIPSHYSVIWFINLVL